MIKNTKPIAIAAITLSISGCSVTSAIDKTSLELKLPSAWHSQANASTNDIEQDWLQSFEDKQLLAFISIALENNHAYKASRLTLAQAEQQVIVSGAKLLPELSLSANQSRRKSVTQSNNVYANNAEITAQLSYELDVWGKLSSEQKRANLALASAKTQLRQQALDLSADVSRLWFNLIESKQLLALYKQRASNLTRNLDIIQSSYQLGITDALDVYLTQNDVNRELARVAEQSYTVKKLQRELELKLGGYPEGVLKSPAKLPLLNGNINAGEPAQFLTRRFDIASRWYDLLAADASLAIAHKNRFPSFTLTASAGDSADELGNLLAGDALAWSLIGNIAAPLFNGGRLAAMEEQARLTVKQKEQGYLEKVFQAFASVENALENRKALSQRYDFLFQAQDNAQAAEKLAFDQYMKGLISYTSVLESQRRAFDAQTQLIQVTNQIIQNKINLHMALGGSSAPLFSHNNTSSVEKS